MVCGNKSQYLALVKCRKPAPSQNGTCKELFQHSTDRHDMHPRVVVLMIHAHFMTFAAFTFFEQRLAPLDVSIFLVITFFFLQ